MVPLPIILASNASIPKALPPGLVAVFAGGTSGIGKETLKKLASLAVKPKVYIIGRSTSAAERIIADCRILNPEGEYVFLQKELDLMKNIKEVCEEIKSKEGFLNLLVLSAGAPDLSRSCKHSIHSK
jgi:short-subunit dehydrogenase